MMAEVGVPSVFSGYRISGMIGRGGMGVVYSAIQLAFERPAALKLILPELSDDEPFRNRFKREARLAAEIDHPNVIPVYETGESRGRLFLSMRLIDGTDLGALVATRGRLSPETATAIVTQVASALDVAHARGLVHRDVKPANVLLEGTVDTHAYLTDFGLSKHTDSRTALTSTGRWVGSIDYAAPEQVQGAETDARSDVYALGCLLYEVLTGEVPFPRTREVSKLAAHVTEPPPLVSETTGLEGLEAFDEVVGTAMAKDPGHRYSSAGELAGAAMHARDRARLESAGEPLREGPRFSHAHEPADRDAPTAA